jgi:outer membrane protein OmpA-like peptidoglycan-associated protein
MADSELKRMESARIEAEQKRAEASKQAEEFEKMQAEMARLGADKDKIDKWLKTDPPKTSETSLGQLGSLASELPTACAERLEVAHHQFADQGFSKKLWLQHVFECQECCAPILNDVMDQHVALAVQQPHTVVLFDFDQYTIKAKYKEQLQALMTTAFDASRDKVLLIGRASKIGDRGYNIALSGKRAGEIRDYLTTTFDVAEEQIRYQFFGSDPPQLTLDYAAQYGISTEDLVAADANATKAEAKVNQSVEVIIYKGSEINEVLNASEGAGANKHGSSSKP